MSISVAPSWHETTLQWMEENCREYLGGRGTPVERLAKALRKSSFYLVAAGMDKKREQEMIDEAVVVWDASHHNEFRVFHGAGGYKPAVSTEIGDKAEALDLDALDEQALEDLDAPGEPREQSIDEVVADEQLHGDERFGAW
jgi:hypothetical protein